MGRRPKATYSPDYVPPPSETLRVDAYVGHRIRVRRKMLGISQSELGDALGVAFQQLQKYERGVNRISASKLHSIARLLNVPVSYFFDGLPAVSSDYAGSPNDEQEAAEHAEFLGNAELARLLSVFYRIPKGTVRQQIIELAKSMAADPALASQD